MKSEQLAALISLLHVPLVGAYKARNLVTTFHEIKDIFTLSKTDLCRVDGIDVKTAEQIRNNYDLDLGQKELEKAAKSGVTILSLWDKEFPYLLKKIYTTRQQYSIAEVCRCQLRKTVLRLSARGLLRLMADQ